MNKKVAIFVREVSFANQYFDHVLDGLSDDYEIHVIHTTKLDKGKSVRCDFKNHDISYYGHFKVRQLLKSINPETILITNIRSLFDIYLVSICNGLGILITYLEHGISLNKMSAFKLKNKRHSLWKYLNYTYKAFEFVLLDKTGRRHIKGILKAILYSDYKNLRLDNAIFYTVEGKNVLERFFNMEDVRIDFSGYPIVNTVYELRKLQSIIPNNQVLYIHQPLILDNFSSLKFEEEINLLVRINEICDNAGLKFIVKCHPRDDISLYKSRLGESVVDNGNADVHELVAQSKIVLGHFSTALFSAILLKRALFILDFWKIKVDSISYFNPLNKTFGSLDSLERNLREFDGVDEEIYKNFRSKYIGYENTHEERIIKLKRIISNS